MTRRRFHLNVAGPFYVEDGNCITCGAPEHEAPTLMGSVEGPEHHCYFKRQPETPEEVEQAISAVRVSCCEAVRYDGDDPGIRARIDAAQPPRSESPTAPALTGVAWAAIAVALTFLASPTVRANAVDVGLILVVVVGAASHLVIERRRRRAALRR